MSENNLTLAEALVLHLADAHEKRGIRLELLRVYETRALELLGWHPFDFYFYRRPPHIVDEEAQRIMEAPHEQP
ncbi:hypothetical protein GCM10009847_10720 [Leucobacter tardus]|uniref:Uncharacterized protein n=1 Tax=Leucobacter tardus TaxID=501483 RepID=A0A939QDQ4_9MICO|nr:hypothetical protein [Leucobacter tardus]MBO2989268.1 hypothetical protein [Leucobacter tardus]